MYCLPRDVSATDTDDGLVLLDGRRGRYWQLNPTGAAVLRSLLDGDDDQRAAQRLCERAGVPPERGRQDVQRLIEALRSARLLVRR